MNRHVSDFQNLGMLLVACFGAALIICGVIVMKTRVFDRRSEGERAYPHSRTIGLLLVIVGAILLALSLMLLAFG